MEKNTSKPVITICMAHRNASDFFAMILYSLEKLSVYPYKIKMRDNDSSSREFANLQRVIKKYSHIDIELSQRKTDLRGSIVHGEALNDLVEKIDTEYGVIMDTDVAFLQKGWDKTLIDALTPEMPVYGTQADSHGPKPKDFPLMFGMLFKADVLKKLRVDWRPKDLTKLQDVGWDLREKYRAAGLQGGLIYAFNTRTHKGGPYRNIVCTEYYMDSQANDPIFACHFGRGSTPSYKNLVRIQSSAVIAKLINRLLLVVNYVKWKLDKRKWLKITKELIDKEYAR